MNNRGFFYARMEEEKNPVGRPSELIESLGKAKEYLDGGYLNVNEVIPNIAGLACYLGKSRSTVYLYAKQNTEFSDILEGILAMQESKLITGGLQGVYNPTITKLMLTKHGYSDRQDVDHTSSDGSLAQRPTTIILKAKSVDSGDNTT